MATPTGSPAFPTSIFPSVPTPVFVPVQQMEALSTGVLGVGFFWGPPQPLASVPQVNASMVGTIEEHLNKMSTILKEIDSKFLNLVSMLPRLTECTDARVRVEEIWDMLGHVNESVAQVRLVLHGGEGAGATSSQAPAK